MNLLIEEVARELGFKRDNYYSAAEKMFRSTTTYPSENEPFLEWRTYYD